jgi:hypothetical protein
VTRGAGGLLLGAVLLALLAAAPRPVGGPAVPRQTALDRIREGGGGFRERYVRIDAKEAKLITLAEWYGVNGSAPLPAQPTRAPGSTPGPVDPRALTPVVPPEAREHLVWAVVAHGEIEVAVPAPAGSGQRPAPVPYPWTGIVLDAQTGQVLQGFTRPDGPWVEQWWRLPDRDATRPG